MDEQTPLEEVEKNAAPNPRAVLYLSLIHI